MMFPNYDVFRQITTDNRRLRELPLLDLFYRRYPPRPPVWHRYFPQVSTTDAMTGNDPSRVPSVIGPVCFGRMHAHFNHRQDLPGRRRASFYFGMTLKPSV